MELLTKTRSVASVVSAAQTTEGDGVPIRRAFPGRALEDIDPFLLLDEMGPLEFSPGSHAGFPDHPHRGFETVTYVLEGAMEHRDSRGNHGILGPGHVQWMTAGAGLVHSEMPGLDLQRKGGRLHGFQLWVNLPARDKMVEPQYQELPGSSIPAVADSSGLVKVRIIAGEALGAHAAIRTRTPIAYLHFTLQPGGEHTQQVPRGWNAFAYVIDGELDLGEDRPRVAAGRMAVFARDSDFVTLSNPGRVEANVLLIAGEPLGEPVARYGPFVMNTRDEIKQAVEDFRSGRMGTIS
jgi:hypothetical protein